MPPITLARAPYNPRPGFTLPQLLAALSSLPQARWDRPPGKQHPTDDAYAPRILVRVEGTNVELPILTIIESLAPDGSTLVLLASEPPPGAPPSRSSSSTTTPTPPIPTT